MRYLSLSLREGYWRAICCAAVCLLSSCATINPENDIDTTQAASTLASVQAPWVATGRLFVTTTSDSASVRFEWHHIDAENERVRLSGALNMGSLHLIRSQDQLIDGKTGETLALSPDSKASAFERLVTSLPLDLWHQLISGQTPDAEGVQASVTAWQSIEAALLPKRVDVEIGDAKLKFAITHWELDKTTSDSHD